MSAFSWLFKSRKGENSDGSLPPEPPRPSELGPVVEIPAAPQDDYERTRPVFDIPEWEPDMPAAIEDYGRTEAIFDVPAWEPEAPSMAAQPQSAEVEEYGPTRAIFDTPEWEPDVPAAVEDYGRTEAISEVPAWEPEAPSMAEQPQSAAAEEYGPTSAISEVPKWEQEPRSVMTEVLPKPVIRDGQIRWMDQALQQEPAAPAMEEPQILQEPDPLTEWEEPVQEIQPYVPTGVAEEYAPTCAVFEEPEMEEMPRVLPEQERLQLMEEFPVWDEDAPAEELPPAAAVLEEYEPTRAVFDIPEWEPDVPVFPARSEVERELPEAELTSVREPEADVIQVPEQIPSWQESDYERTQPAFCAPAKEPEVSAVDMEATVFSATAAAPVRTLDENKSQPSGGEPRELPRESVSAADAWEITGKGTEKPPLPEAPVKPAAPVAERVPVKEKPKAVPAAPAEGKVPEQEAPKPAPASRRAAGIPVKPKVATPTAVDMKTPEVPDFGRSISAEVCDFSLRQQWNWLDKLHEVIPTLRLGTEPTCVDYPLTLRNMEAVGDMRVTVKRVAMGVGIILSITNLENAITCEDISKLREAAQILSVYGKMVSGRQADAIRMTVRYLGVRVAELQMR